ncbi:MAG: prolyl oligopeptidase family serine peptidase [Verrucomicrobiota bacterium]|nr:prolyl oligopeptidase family serine peptidase [Verrucomicrobiota bacterium]
MNALQPNIECLVRALRAPVIAALALADTSPPLSARDPLSGEAAVFSDGTDAIPYRLYRPEGSDTPGASVPLVLFLHGAGERGTNNTAQVTAHIQGLIDTTETGSFAGFLIAPQCPPGQDWANFNSPTLSTPLRLVLDLVDQFIAENPVDAARVYVTGLSMGGFGAFDALERRPDLFAAAAPLSSGGNLSAVDIYKEIPIWAFHGANDTTVPPGASRNTMLAIESQGGTKDRYTELAGQGHVIWAPIYNGASFAFDSDYSGRFAPDGSDDLYSWMFAQVNPIPEPATAGFLVACAALLAMRRRRIPQQR